MARNFFEERSDQSEVKARIIQKYFATWAKVVGPTAKKVYGRMAYIDLYAGPGRYRDGAASTPLLVLENAIQDEMQRDMLVTYFNDRDSNNTSTLKGEIAKLDGIATLKYQPTVNCGEVDQDAAKFFVEQKLVPSFTFVDPFGYKGLSLQIVNGVIKDWGCDCVFFFNYNRINPGISNPAVEPHMNALFGKERADKLRAALPQKSPTLREALILEELAQAIKEMGGNFVLPFRFKNEAGTRTSHSLIFVSKHFRGYDIMKGIMAKESSTQEQGVASFTYSPADASMPLLLALQRPLDDLGDMLMNDFAGQEASMLQIYESHSVDTPYTSANYKRALLNLEESGLITVVSGASTKRRAGTFADHLIVRFPK